MSVFASCFGTKSDKDSSSENESDHDVKSKTKQQQQQVVEEEDEVTKQERKIAQAKQIFKGKLANIDDLFRADKSLLNVTIKPPTELKGQGVTIGPPENGVGQSIEDIIYAKSVSCYPRKPTKPGNNNEEVVKTKERLGDPICDCYSFDVIESSQAIIATADGCNWGPKPFEAARIACEAFQAYTHDHLADFTTVREAGRLLVKAFSSAHANILHAPLNRGINDIWETGTTTLIGGVLLQLNDTEVDKLGAPWIFICANVGDCKALHCSATTGEVVDITIGTRPPSAITNVNDPGGRLGPYVGKEGGADLRNLTLFYTLCQKNDILLLFSDGVYDNLDPQQLGVAPADIGLDAPSWEDADADAAEKVRDKYRVDFIKKKILELSQSNGTTSKEKAKEKKKKDDNNNNNDDKENNNGGKRKNKSKKGEQSSSSSNDGIDQEALIEAINHVSIEELTESLLQYSKDVTKYSRKWMQEHPTARMPDARSKKKDPAMLGKMDHTTCVAMRVGQQLQSHSADSSSSPSNKKDTATKSQKRKQAAKESPPKKKKVKEKSVSSEDESKNDDNKSDDNKNDDSNDSSSSSSSASE